MFYTTYKVNEFLVHYRNDMRHDQTDGIVHFQQDTIALEMLINWCWGLFGMWSTGIALMVTRTVVVLVRRGL
jgi:hypothetical protein